MTPAAYVRKYCDGPTSMSDRFIYHMSDSAIEENEEIYAVRNVDASPVHYVKTCDDIFDARGFVSIVLDFYSLSRKR